MSMLRTRLIYGYKFTLQIITSRFLTRAYDLPMHGLVTRLMVLLYLRSSFCLLVLKTQKIYWE